MPSRIGSNVDSEWETPLENVARKHDRARDYSVCFAGLPLEAPYSETRNPRIRKSLSGTRL